MTELAPHKPRSPFLAVMSLLFGLASLPSFGLAILFNNAMLADAVSLTILIAFLLGICTGFINTLGLILGGLGIFLSRRVIAIIGLVLNLAVLVGTILIFV